MDAWWRVGAIPRIEPLEQREEGRWETANSEHWGRGREGPGPSAYHPSIPVMPLLWFVFKTCGILLSPTAGSAVWTLGVEEVRLKGIREGRVIKSLLERVGLGEMPPVQARKPWPGAQVMRFEDLTRWQEERQLCPTHLLMTRVSSHPASAALLEKSGDAVSLQSANDLLVASSNSVCAGVVPISTCQ